MCVKSLQNCSRNGQIAFNSTRHSSHPPVSLFIDPEEAGKPEFIGNKVATVCLIEVAASPVFEMIFFFAPHIAGKSILTQEVFWRINR
jgi:hypothetical protein